MVTWESSMPNPPKDAVQSPRSVEAVHRGILRQQIGLALEIGQSHLRCLELGFWRIFGWKKLEVNQDRGGK